MNVVLVVVDTLRKDCVGVYGRPEWWAVATPCLDAFAAASLTFTRAYPESLPTLPARRALYTGMRTYPFHGGDGRLKGDFVPAPGWGPIPETQHTLAEILQAAGWRTALVSDLYHQFKPSKNFWRGFDQWTFIRGQEDDPYRSGPEPTPAEVDHWCPPELGMGGPHRLAFARRCLRNMHDRAREEDWFNAQVFREAARWLEQNRDAARFFLTVECFDPHEPWFVPRAYRERYDPGDGPEQVFSPYRSVRGLPSALLRRTRASYSGLVTMVDRWLGHFLEALRTTGRLDDTLVVVVADHGHTIGERGYMGKRGYRSAPEVVDVPLLVRHPEGRRAGERTDLVVQHHDVAAFVLDLAGVAPPAPLDGRSFAAAAYEGGPPIRRHATVAWGDAVTVVRDRAWLNVRVNGRGAFLHDLGAPGDPLAVNLADAEPALCRELFALAVADAGGPFPDYLLARAAETRDAPGCSAIAAGA
jgi:arylsulfatase A-like enzyme